MRMMSYAQNREDVVLARCFPAASGFYIDVGAANPVNHSVTKWFSTRGWSGVNIEPHPLFFKLIEADRPNEFNVNAAVSDSSGEIDYYEVPNSIGCSTVNPELAEHYRTQGYEVITHIVRTVTLAEICERYVRGPIDFLKIDAEGHELEVLNSMDFRQWKPKVLVIEATAVDTWNHVPLANGYQFGLFDGLNRYYVHDDHRELLPRIAAPASCLDDYEIYDHVEQIRQLERDLARARRLEAAARQELANGTPAPTNAAPHSVPQEEYDKLLALHQEAQHQLNVLRQKTAAEPAVVEGGTRTGRDETPPTPVSVAPATPAFFEYGCVSSSRWKWPVMAARRLLRRLQRPFFFALQAELEAVRARDAELRAAVAQLQADQDSFLNLSRSDAAPDRSTPVAEAITNAGLHPFAIVTKLESLDRALCEVATSPAGAPRKPSPQPYRVLFALTSSCQMYSGIGRTIFETVKQLRGRVEYEFAMDDGEERNVRLLSEFCKEHGLPLHIGRSVLPTRTMDRGNADLPNLLREQRWDAFEVASWGSSATNQAVLDHARDTPLIYQPYYQPISSVPGAENSREAIERAHFGLLRQGSLVVCCSPWEWLTLQADAGPSPAHFALVPLGIDRDAFMPGRRERRPYLLFVGDFRERRKRLPLTLDVFAEVLKTHPQMQLVIVGNESERMMEKVPEPLRQKVVLMGYVSEERLHELYRESMGLMLLSDYEAFGMPILEALASGTPAFISRRSTVSTLFAGYKGAVFVDDDRPDQMGRVISAAFDRWPQLVQETLADVARIAQECSWDALSQQRFEAIRRALARSVGYDREFRIRPTLAVNAGRNP